MSQETEVMCLLYGCFGTVIGIAFIIVLWAEIDAEPTHKVKKERRFAAICTLFAPLVCAIAPIALVLLLLAMLGKGVAKLITIAAGEA